MRHTDKYESGTDADVEATLDDFTEAEIGEYIRANPDILCDACAVVAEEDPAAWDEIVERATRGPSGPRTMVEAFEALDLFDKEAAWSGISEVARRSKLPGTGAL